MVSRAELLGVAAEIQANERDSTEFAPKTPQSLHAEGLLRGDEERERERERESSPFAEAVWGRVVIAVLDRSQLEG